MLRRAIPILAALSAFAALCACASPRPSAPAPLALRAPPPAPSAAPSASASGLPSALAVPRGLEVRDARSFAPAPGSAAAMCTAADGEVADALRIAAFERAAAACKAPAHARFVFRFEASLKGTALREVIERGGDERLTKCAAAAVSAGGFTMTAADDDAPRTYDCYVAFY